MNELIKTELTKAVQPVMKWLKDYGHSHMKSEGL